MIATVWGRFLDSPAFREVALLLDNWVYLLPILILLMAVGCGLGRALGFPYIFREDEQVFSPARCWRPASPPQGVPGGLLARLPGWMQLALASPALWSGFGFMAAFGLFWIAVHGSGVAYCGAAGGASALCPTMLFNAEAAPEGRFWMVVALAVTMALFLLLTWRELRRQLADFTTRDGAQKRAELLRTAAGCAMGAVFVLAAMQAATWLGSPGRYMWIVAAPYIVLLFYLFLQRSVLPCLSLASLIVGLILIGSLFPRDWWVWEAICVILGFALVVAVNHGRGRYRLPGFEPLYDHLLNPQGKEDRAGDTRLIPPRMALESWRDRHAPEHKPVLVLLATSGGAYRAAFWTGLLMDRLVAESGPEGRWPGLADDIRLITGASGGMVAGTYFAAMAAEGRLAEGVIERISRDTWARMGAADGDARRHPIARDSLSPIVHRLVTRDLLHLVVPMRPRNDRGRVLDRQWPTLGRSFASIRASEAAGIAPSVILSPMLVETGAVALFSNLDLMEIRRRALPDTAKPGDEDKASVEIFRTFPGTHENVSVATAVRLNATFPYISPAISLPASPDRRVVDAGYYDNYGIDLLTAYLDQPATREWIHQNCSGVAILQIRAFPSEPPTKPVGRVARALQFLTSPVEAIMRARRASQIFRNDQQLAQVRARYNLGNRDFLKVFTFEASTDVSMSWYLRCDELRALERLLSPPVQDDLIWDAKAVRERGWAAQSAGPEVLREEVERWTLDHYRDEEDDKGQDDDKAYKSFISALQRQEPEAQWAQFLHHRAKIAAEFDKLAEFWR